MTCLDSCSSLCLARHIASSLGGYSTCVVRVLFREGHNERGNWAQLGEVVDVCVGVVEGGEAAKRSHRVLVLMRTPLGSQHIMSPTTGD